MTNLYFNSLDDEIKFNIIKNVDDEDDEDSMLRVLRLELNLSMVTELLKLKYPNIYEVYANANLLGKIKDTTYYSVRKIRQDYKKKRKDLEIEKKLYKEKRVEWLIKYSSFSEIEEEEKKKIWKTPTIENVNFESKMRFMMSPFGKMNINYLDELGHSFLIYYLKVYHPEKFDTVMKDEILSHDLRFLLKNFHQLPDEYSQISNGVKTSLDGQSYFYSNPDVFNLIHESDIIKNLSNYPGVWYYILTRESIWPTPDPVLKSLMYFLKIADLNKKISPEYSYVKVYAEKLKREGNFR